MISSVKRYTDLLAWLLADIWSTSPRLVVAVFGLDVLGLATMAGAYGLGRSILGQVDGKGGPVTLWGYHASVLGAIGIAAALILLALLVQSAARLASHRFCLTLAVRHEAVTVFQIWEKLRELRRRGGVQGDPAQAGWMHRLATGNGRALGTSARLAVMAISGTLTALFFGALAVLSTPKTALVFLVIGFGMFGFMLRNNRLAALANRRSREFGLAARMEMKQLFKRFVRGEEEKLVGEQLRRLVREGPAGRAAEACSEQLYRVYQSQFFMSAGAAFAIAFALLLPLLEKPKGGAAVPMAMTAAGLVLLKQAFGYAGSVAAHLTRLNLRYRQLLDHRKFLQTGQIPGNLITETADEDEASDAEC